MAISVETGGVGFNPIAVSGYVPPLAALKPLTFKPAVEIAPLAGWSVPSSQPELISAGLQTGLNAISRGIIAKYRDQAYVQGQKERGLAAAELSNARLKETIRHDKAMENRVNSALPPDYNIGEDSQEESKDTEQQSTDTSDTSEIPVPLEGENPFNSINLPEDENQAQASTKINAPLFGLNTPVLPEQGQNPALAALSSVNWGGVGAEYKGAGTPSGSFSPATDWLRNPKAVTNQLSILGGIPNNAMPVVGQAINALSGETQQAPQATQNNPTWGTPRSAFKDYASAQKYMESQKGNPDWYPSGTPKPDKFGNFIIPWKAQNPQFVQQHQDLANQRDRRLDFLVSNQLAQEPKRFESENNVKNYTSQRGLMQMLVRLSPTYESAMKDPVHSAIPDAGIAQLMAQAESGGVPAISTIEGYLHSQGISDTIDIMKNKAMGGNSGLSPRQKNQIYDLLTAEAKAQASLANQTVDAYHTQYKDRVANPEDYIHHFILPKTKEEAKQEAIGLLPIIKSAKQARDEAEQSGDHQAFTKADKEWRDASNRAWSLKHQIDSASGHIINMDEILTKPQGFLAPVPLHAIKPEGLRMLKSEAQGQLTPQDYGTQQALAPTE